MTAARQHAYPKSWNVPRRQRQPGAFGSSAPGVRRERCHIIQVGDVVTFRYRHAAAPTVVAISMKSGDGLASPWSVLGRALIGAKPGTIRRIEIRGVAISLRVIKVTRHDPGNRNVPERD